MKRFLLFLFIAVVAQINISAQYVVDMTNAGTLREQITDAISDVSTLKISGPINGTDLRYIRELCGMNVSGGPSAGHLTQLDLSDARIVSGGDYYMYDYNSYEEFFSKNDELGDYTFFNCPWIELITIPKTLKKIGTSAFSSCVRLHQIEAPEDCEEFYSIDGAIYSKADSRLIKYPQARNLRVFNVPEGTKIIGYDAVSDALTLELVTLPEGLTTIERTAFCFSNNLVNIDIPSTVTSIGVSAFNYCAGLEALNVAEGNSVYTSVDGVLYTKDMTTLFRCPIKRQGSYIVPESVTTIEEYAFSSCTKLSDITLPTSLTTMRNWSLDGCSGLTEITIPASVTSVGNGVFSGCSGVSKISLPDAVTQLGKWLFYGCSALKDVQFSSNVSQIGDGAFQSCESLEAFVMPENVKNVANQLFYGCSALKNVELPKGLISIGAYSFYGCKALVNMTVFAAVPPVCQMYPFYQVPTATCVLRVPYGSADDYRDANEWKNFRNVEEMENTSINDIVVDATEQWFSIDGKPLTAPQKGLNILRKNDGSTMKVIR